MQKVSYGDETQCCHGGQETIGEKFPVGVKYNGAMADRELFAKGFLLR